MGKDFITTKNCVCFTGHREIPYREKKELKEALSREIDTAIEGGASDFCCGGALGFDTLAAETVLKKKETNPEIKLILILPCRNQDKYWSYEDRKKYEEIKSLADDIIYTASTYYNGCMQVRNKALVDRSDICIAYLRKLTGGSASTVKYAEKCGIKIIHI